MPSLVATTSALARKPCVSTHYVRTNILDRRAKGRAEALGKDKGKYNEESAAATAMEPA